MTFPGGILEINTYEIKSAIAARAEKLAVILLRSLSSLVSARCVSLSTRYSELQDELLQPLATSHDIVRARALLLRVTRVLPQ